MFFNKNQKQLYGSNLTLTRSMRNVRIPVEISYSNRAEKSNFLILIVAAIASSRNAPAARFQRQIA